MIVVRRFLVLALGALALALLGSAPALAASIEPGSVSVSEVSSSAATLNAKLDPEGVDTTYVFQYATSKFTGGVAPAGSAEVGAGNAGSGAVGVPVSVQVQGLTADTTYSYRLLAGGVGSEEASFTTQPTGSEFALPEGRRWELVSPVNKHGAGIEPIFENGAVIQAAEDGGSITYASNAPTESDPQGNRALEFSQLLSTRDPGKGWATQDITAPNNRVEGLTLNANSAYRMFSPDLSTALLEPVGDEALPPQPEDAERTIYQRNNTTGSFLPLVDSEDVLVAGAHLALPAESFEGASPNLEHIVFFSTEALTPNALRSEGELRNLYEWSAKRPPSEQLQLVSILPNGQPSDTEAEGREPREAYLGRGNFLVRNAVSDDGTRVVWEQRSGATVSEEQVSRLFLRDTSTGETVQLNVPQSGTPPFIEGEGGELRFQGASSDGSRIFFTDTMRLTPDSQATEEDPDLYVFEVSSGGGPLHGTVTDLTDDAVAGEPARIQGDVLGYSETGCNVGPEADCNVYFVADGVLAGTEGAAAGECGPISFTEGLKCNLYMDHYNGSGWEARFIARLPSEDYNDWDGTEAGKLGNLGHLTSRVAPNGDYLAFMSAAPLTGYDNHDLLSGADDEEVYLYDAADGRIACASCNPFGSRPEGVHDPVGHEHLHRLLVDEPGLWTGMTLAGDLPGWTFVEQERALYQSRYLSNSGQLFFNAADSLVPADVNGKMDVYEYRPQGPDCGSADESQSEVYKVEGEGASETAGCVSLLSSGTSSKESAFLDASASGEDVFFLTTSQLTAEDADSAYDVYDAHVCSESVPCPAPSVSTPPCADTDSCRAASALQPAIFGAPASATFSGDGNVVAPAPAAVTVKRKTVAEVKAEKLAQALKACRRKARAKRTKCERQARKRYGSRKRREPATSGGQSDATDNGVWSFACGRVAGSRRLLGVCGGNAVVGGLYQFEADGSAAWLDGQDRGAGRQCGGCVGQRGERAGGDQRQAAGWSEGDRDLRDGEL